jgi:hypothetical protein
MTRVDPLAMDGLISFFSSYHAMRAEVMMTRAGMAARLVPGPRELSPNCGVALRFHLSDRERTLAVLAAKQVRIDGVHEYRPRTDVFQAPVDTPRAHGA